MADDRLHDIREGAGKDDNRYSELMTDLLNKAGPYIMAAVIICSGGYLGYKYYDNRKNAALSAAFFELEQAIASGSPATLEAVARDHAGQRSVTRVAETELGEIYLAAARRGTAPGSTLKETGLPEREEDILTSEQVTQYLTKASAAFQATYDATKSEPAQALHTVKALFGLAAVAESKGDLEAAGRYYTDAAERAKAGGFEPLAQMAIKRKETAGGLSAVTPLFKTAELPARVEAASPFPTTPPPGAAGATPINVTTPGGGPAPTITPMSVPPAGFGPDGKPLPAGQPAPTPSDAVGPPAPPATPAPAPAPTTAPAPAPAPAQPKQDPKR